MKEQLPKPPSSFLIPAEIFFPLNYLPSAVATGYFYAQQAPSTTTTPSQASGALGNEGHGRGEKPGGRSTRLCGRCPFATPSGGASPLLSEEVSLPPRIPRQGSTPGAPLQVTSRRPPGSSPLSPEPCWRNPGAELLQPQEGLLQGANSVTASLAASLPASKHQFPGAAAPAPLATPSPEAKEG